MFYVNDYNKLLDKYSIMDTTDGVAEWYTKKDILGMPKGIKIKGVSGSTVKVVNLASVANDIFNAISQTVKREIDSYGMDKCLELAKSIHFVKQLKGVESITEARRITSEYVYPSSVQEVVNQAAEYTNDLHEVQLTPQDIKNALMNNVCLVLQHKTNGALSAFICSGSLKVLDYVYEPSFFESVYLTKQLYGYTKGINSVRGKSSDDRPENPDMLNVFSCSLRFRREGTKHDGQMKELSSPFYTVNIPRVMAMFTLDNPSKIGDKILPEFAMSGRKDDYKFDFSMYQDIRRCIEDGTNYFGNEDTFLKYIDMQTLEKAIDLSELQQRFGNNFDYIEWIRMNGYSFKI